MPEHVDFDFPMEASFALEALKEQANVLRCSMPCDKVDKAALKEAQQSMRQLEPWTGMVARLLQREGVSVSVATHDWLEEMFAAGRIG